MTVDRAALRKLVEGWKPGMTVQIRVDVLTALLDELDTLRAANGGIGVLTKEELDDQRQNVLAHDFGVGE